jgi:hypothetical protein
MRMPSSKRPASRMTSELYDYHVPMPADERLVCNKMCRAACLFG